MQTATFQTSRREFLRVGSAGLCGLTLADLLRSESTAAKSDARRRTAEAVIVVWLSGGPATIDMWDLKPNAPEEIRGEFQPINTSAAGVQICEYLPKMAKVMDRCVLVRSVHHGLPAHGPGTRYVMSGNLPSPAVEYPSLGSLASALLPARKGVPAYLTVGNQPASGAGYLGASQNPFRVQSGGFRGRLTATHVSLPDGFTKSELVDRNELRRALDRRFAKFDKGDSLLAGLDTFQQQALDILRTDRIAKALDVNGEPKAVLKQYGRTVLGRHALAARRLIEAGARFVTVGMGGWDTHSGNFASLRTRLLPALDAALAALIADLDQRGLLKTTLVYCAGEFGRTPQVNRNAGRDHWARASSVLLAGGGMKRGDVYGSTDKHGKTPASHACSPDDVAATILSSVGFPPDYRVAAANGRPMTLFRHGKVLRGLRA